MVCWLLVQTYKIWKKCSYCQLTFKNVLHLVAIVFCISSQNQKIYSSNSWKVLYDSARKLLTSLTGDRSSDFFIVSPSSCFSSVQFSRSVVSNSLRPHGLQHARPPCPSPLLEFTQTHVHWVGDAIQPSHLLLSPSPPAINLSQHQGLFQGVSSSHQVAKVLQFQLQHQFIQWIFRTDFL